MSKKHQLILTHPQVLKYCKTMCNIFATTCDKDIITITDYLYAMFLSDAPKNYDLDMFYNTLDAYTELQSTYQTLVFNHELLKKGKTRKQWFVTMCQDLY